MIPSPPNPTLQSPVLQTALQSAANAILIADREGRIIWVNLAFTRLTGYTPEEALGRNPRLRRIKGYRHLPPLRAALQREIASSTQRRESVA